MWRVWGVGDVLDKTGFSVLMCILPPSADLNGHFIEVLDLFSRCHLLVCKDIFINLQGSLRAF